MKRLILTIAWLCASTCVQAADVYQLTGIAQSFSQDTDETHEIDPPTIPHYASTLSIEGDEVTLHYGGGDGTCVAHIEKRNPYVFDDGPSAAYVSARTASRRRDPMRCWSNNIRQGTDEA